MPGKWDSNPRFHRRSLLWIGLTVVALLMTAFLPKSVWETGYYRGLFRVIRILYDFSLGWLPLPMIYIAVTIVLFRTWRWAKEWQKGWRFQVSRGVGGVCALIFLFYLLWGFNYGQISFPQHLGLQEVGMTEAEMLAEFRQATAELKAEALNLPANLQTTETIKSKKVRDHDLRTDVERALRQLNLPTTGRVRVRQLWPKGLLMRLSTAGIYIPHAAEGHIDGGLLSVQKPYTMAHEMAHGYGVTDEGACNFVAWLACHESADPWMRYSGAYSYWRSAAAGIPDSIVLATLEELPPIVTQTIQLVRKNNQQYPDILPNIRNAIYDTYLKRHGISSGLRNYHEVVMMVHHFREKQTSGLPGK